MDGIKNMVNRLKEMKIAPENDSFQLFEEYARQKQNKKKPRLVWLYTAVAVLSIMLVVRGITEQNRFLITDFCDGSLCLCDKSFEELQQQGYDFREVSVVNDCIENCFSCETGKWYASNKLKGIILQKAAHGDEIFRIRFTKDYKGKLPNGQYVKMEEIQLEDLHQILQMENWYADNCSDYASLSQDNYRVLVKADSPIKLGFTDISNNELSGIPIEAIEIFNHCRNN